MNCYSEKRENSVILGVTIGSILEWYEIYLFIYWSPIIANLFFDYDSEATNLINAFLLFGIGFLARPLGGILFGRLGDRIGRKRTLIFSIVSMAVPTFGMGLLPTHQTIGWLAPVILALLRLLQAMPAGGELPGAFCYLYECTGPKHRRYMTSWGAVGNQIGIFISMLECLILEKLLTHDQLVSWGWRFSFILGGFIGLFGFYLRFKLHETISFQDIVRNHELTKRPILEVIFAHIDKIWTAILYCLLNSVGFYLLSVFVPVYFENILMTSYDTNIILSMILIVVTTIPLPFIGMIGDRINNKAILVTSTIAIIVLIYPMYLSVLKHKPFISAIVAGLFILFFTCLTALIPYRFADLFPTPVRFTCVGLSYNLVDGIAGGFSPVLALYLFNKTGSISSFYWILFISSLMSLYAFMKIKEKKTAEI